MKNTEQLFNELTSLSEEEVISKAQEATNKLARYLQDVRGLDEQKSFKYFVHIISLFISADGHCGQEEWKLFNKILEGHYTYEAFYWATNGGTNKSFETRMINEIKNLPEEEKKAACTIGMVFLLSDKELTLFEKKLFEKII